MFMFVYFVFIFIHTAFVLYYCNTVGWTWLDWNSNSWDPIFLQCFDTVGWVI